MTNEKYRGLEYASKDENGHYINKHGIHGAVYSGDVAHQLWTKGEVVVYLFIQGKHPVRWDLVMEDGKERVRHPNDQTAEFSFAGLLHTMNDDSAWNSVVFLNFWYAAAYARKMGIDLNTITRK